MSNRTAIITLAAAALTMMSTATPASAREVVRYNAEVQPGVKTLWCQRQSRSRLTMVSPELGS